MFKGKSKNSESDDQNKKVEALDKLRYLNALKIDDTYSLGLLSPLLSGYPFIPFTGSSIRPFCLAHITNDIIINNRKSIIEFGSGISTIVIGRLIAKNDLDTTLISVEHDQAWAERLSQLIQKERLPEKIKIIWAPLKECDFSLDYNTWYDTEILNKEIANEKFDMVIVDGPPAWEALKEKARYPALPFIRTKLMDNYSAYLDDANRQGERSIIQLWENKFMLKFTISGNTLAYTHGGASFYTEPIIYAQ